MALALRCERLIVQGAVWDCAGLARLGHVSRAWVIQDMNLLQLAPDIQGRVLFLPRTVRGRDLVHLRPLQPIAAALEWCKQRRPEAAALGQVS
jgi:hypothetical protein